MAIEGRILGRSRIKGSRLCRVLRRRSENAFGLLSIALARSKLTRCGLTWADITPELSGRGWAQNSLRTSNGAVTTVITDLVPATIT